MTAVGDNFGVRSFRGAWSLAGLVAGAAGLATSYFVAMAMTLRESPVVAVAQLVIKLTPGWLAHYLIERVGHLDKPLLVTGILVVLALLFAWAGRLARRAWWASVLIYAVLALVAAVAALQQTGATTVDVIPIAVGFVTWLVTLSLLTEPLRRADLVVHHVPEAGEPDVLEPLPPGDHTRRAFMIRVGLLATAAVVVGGLGRVIGRGRRHVEESRRLLRLPQATEPVTPPGVRVGVKGVTPWGTSAARFYRIDTELV